MNDTIIILLIPLLGTVIGSAFVFLMKNKMPECLQKALLGFASGVMVAASVWSLLIPAMEMNSNLGRMAVVPTVVGFLAGIAFLLLLDELLPHLHVGENKPEGLKSHLSRISMLSLAVTIHNFPEGMAVGVVLASSLTSVSGVALPLSGAFAVAIGIAIQNIPEGAIVSMPLRIAGGSKFKAFMAGSLSGVVEPIGAVLIILLASWLTPSLPYLLAFAAGAMLYVVVEELIPEASTGNHSNWSTIGFAVGFALMMVLDVVLI